MRFLKTIRNIIELLFTQTNRCLKCDSKKINVSYTPSKRCFMTTGLGDVYAYKSYEIYKCSNCGHKWISDSPRYESTFNHNERELEKHWEE